MHRLTINLKNYMNYIFVIAVCLTLTNVSQAGAASARRATRIGFVEINKIIVGTKSGRDFSKKMEQLQKAEAKAGADWQAAQQQAQVNISNKQRLLDTELKNKEASLTPAALKEAKDAAQLKLQETVQAEQQKLTEAQSKYQIAVNQLGQQLQELTTNFQSELKKSAEKIAKTHGFDSIQPADASFYTHDDYDVTGLLIAEMEKESAASDFKADAKVKTA